MTCSGQTPLAATDLPEAVGLKLRHRLLKMLRTVLVLALASPKLLPKASTQPEKLESPPTEITWSINWWPGFIEVLKQHASWKGSFQDEKRPLKNSSLICTRTHLHTGAPSKELNEPVLSCLGCRIMFHTNLQGVSISCVYVLSLGTSTSRLKGSESLCRSPTDFTCRS